MGTQDPRNERRSFERGRYNSDEARYGKAGSRGDGLGEREPWRRERYGSRYDEDRSEYGSGYDRGYGRGQRLGGSQAYGVEGGHPRYGDDRGRADEGRRERWTPHGAAPYGDLEDDGRASGYEEFGAPTDYAYHPRQGHEFEPDYLNWREEQLRAHDREYSAWRREQHRRYDDDYRRYRAERQDSFGRNFHTWRSQQNMSEGMRSQQVVPGQTDYAGQDAGFGRGGDRPSGKLESPTAMTPDPALSQTGGGRSGAARTKGPKGSEFGKEPDKVKAATDGRPGKDDDKDKDEARH